MKLFASVLVLAAVATGATAEEKSRLRSNLLAEHVENHRRLNCNTDLINEVIDAALPSINEAIQDRVADPLVLEGASTTYSFTLTDGPCSGETATVMATLNEITGLSTIEITEMEVREGSEEVCCGCPTTFDGTFDFDMKADVIALESDLVMSANNPAGGTCDLSTTAISSMANPTASGKIDIAGTISGSELTVTDAKIDRLILNCGTVTTTFTNTGDFGSIVDDINDALGDDFCDLVQTTVIDNLVTAINSGLEQITTNWGYLTSAKYIARFMAANAPTIVSTYLAGDLSETIAKNRAFLNEP